MLTLTRTSVNLKRLQLITAFMANCHVMCIFKVRIALFCFSSQLFAKQLEKRLFYAMFVMVRPVILVLTSQNDIQEDAPHLLL